MNEKYKDIINLAHKQSETRPHMSVYNRAAQFSPFAALSGYESAVRETARLTEDKLFLSDFAVEELNSKLNFLREHIDEQPEVAITYFKADDKKTGGKYIVSKGIIKKIDDYLHVINMQNGDVINAEDILQINCSRFDYTD